MKTVLIVIVSLLAVAGIGVAVYFIIKKNKKKCTPFCSVGECTDDGCGNPCPCGVDQVCDNGVCVNQSCTPNCPSGKCGDDGCGGICKCPNDEQCVDGVCVTGSCVPSCPDLTCGADGCGGSCTCPPNYKCENGACIINECDAERPCQGEKEYCDNGRCVVCTEVKCTNPMKCNYDNGCGGICTCGFETDVCMPDGNCCTPSCPAGTCGSDGCGGTCTCTGTDQCVNGVCQPPCVPKCDGLSCGGDNGCGGECACPPRTHCSNGTCVSTFCSTTCDETCQCPAGTRCVNRRCVGIGA